MGKQKREHFDKKIIIYMKTNFKLLTLKIDFKMLKNEFDENFSKS